MIKCEMITEHSSTEFKRSCEEFFNNHDVIAKHFSLSNNNVYVMFIEYKEATNDRESSAKIESNTTNKKPRKQRKDGKVSN